MSQGSTVIVSVIGLFKELHEFNRLNIENYIEVFLDVPIDELKRRDPKGLYSRYYQGAVKNVAGLDLQVDLAEQPHYHFKWHSELTCGMITQKLYEDYNNRNK